MSYIRVGSITLWASGLHKYILLYLIPARGVADKIKYAGKKKYKA